MRRWSAVDGAGLRTARHPGSWAGEDLGMVVVSRCSGGPPLLRDHHGHPDLRVCDAPGYAPMALDTTEGATYGPRPSPRRYPGLQPASVDPSIGHATLVKVVTCSIRRADGVNRPSQQRVSSSGTRWACASPLAAEGLRSDPADLW